MYTCRVSWCKKLFITDPERRTHYEREHNNVFDYCPYCVDVYMKPGEGRTSQLENHMMRDHEDIEWNTGWEEYKMERSNGRVPRFSGMAPHEKQQYYNPRPGRASRSGRRRGHRQDADFYPPRNVDIAGTSQNDSRPSVRQIQNPATRSSSQEHHGERDSEVAPNIQHPQQPQSDGRQQRSPLPPLRPPPSLDLRGEWYLQGQSSSTNADPALPHAQQQEFDGRQQGPSQPPLSEEDQM